MPGNMAVDIHRHRQAGNMGGHFFNLDFQCGGFTAKALRPNTEGIDFLQKLLLQPAVILLRVIFIQRSQQRLFCKVGCLVKCAADTHTNYNWWAWICACKFYSFYDELLPLVEEKGVQLRCTAAVGGGIGWLSELERARRSQTIQKVGGIMNGTCNYILDSMTRLGLGYDEALEQAQQLGYAEANPTTDVEGIDTWHKVILSSNIAFGISVDHDTVPVTGISQISAQDVQNFKDHGYVCKLVSTGILQEGKLSAFVQPTLFKQGDLEAAVPANYNCITLVGSASGRMSFYGQGAGRYPTAYNVVQDCADLLAGKGFYSPYGGKVAAENDGELSFYVRGAAWPEAAAETWGDAVITKPVAVSKIHAWRKENPDAFIAAMPAK